MAFSLRNLEDLAEWCLKSSELASERESAASQFFAPDDPRPINYFETTGDRRSKERRLLGFFMFTWRLPSGEMPAEMAARRMYYSAELEEALSAITQHRFLFTAVKTLTRRTVWLECRAEQFQVSQPGWSATLQREQALAVHLLPVGHGLWIVGPGWIVLPLSLSPGIRDSLDEMQANEIEFERFLQRRHQSGGDERSEPPDDGDLHSAVARMTTWAGKHGYKRLVMPPTAWESLAVPHLLKGNITAFVEEVMATLPTPPTVANAQELLPLLSNIWNNTPQPDHCGLTANQILRQRSQ